ncbi:alpha/beta hydrolase [Nonomuraea sp. NBC_01738]|uniref:alpha/beta hydrolase n=1 Tax=Nonomuraea sp. NBC_01738 TaxID=2976003 RepID=UPI002E118537|nr:alpha/beta hydrolase [Nonomuraea sp. NBC_01738]
MKRFLAWLVAILLVLGVLGLAGVGWYYSGMVIDPTRGATYPLEVTAADAKSVTLKGGTDTAAPGTYGLTWADGNATLGKVTATAPGTVTREVLKVRRGELKPGVHAYLDRWMWGHEDPKSALGLPYKKVKVRGELGDFPAWLTPGDSKTWVIAVHGRNAMPSEALRITPAFHKLGMPVLGISYRNDEGAPAGDDGKFHLGATEWKEVAAAITYARGHGATGVVLYGYSMGGGIVPMAARNLPKEPIKALILDSPVMDWNAPIELGAKQQGVPLWIASVGKVVVERRTGISLDDLDHVRHAQSFKQSTLMFVDDDDATVPTGPALEFARVRPDLVELVRTKGGGHCGSWNVDPAAYEKAVTDFIRKLPSASA